VGLWQDAVRLLRPLLDWRRAIEAVAVPYVAPCLEMERSISSTPVDVAVTEDGIEAAVTDIGGTVGGDAVIRRMIKVDSGVEFRTLRIGEGSRSAIVVLFSEVEAVTWLVRFNAEDDANKALERLRQMERSRVVEKIDLSELAGSHQARPFNVPGTTPPPVPNMIKYRFVDPWEVEVLERRDDELKAASLGRSYYSSFSIGDVARACEGPIRAIGGQPYLSLWTIMNGPDMITKAISEVHAPWERDSGGELIDGNAGNPPSMFLHAIQRHLYRNALFRRLRMPHRFVGVVQVELLDLKNLAPGAISSLTAYALLRLKRFGSNAPLTQKARTLDSATTSPRKILKSAGPNAPASWGSLVRFRFSLPEDVDTYGVSADRNREALFPGPPTVLQISVHEKRFMNDIVLGDADIKLDGLANGGQLEEWVPLRMKGEKEAIAWFTRVRISLRFEMMCIEHPDSLDASLMERCPSAGLRKIRKLSQYGGAHEDTTISKRSVSTNDILAYLEAIVA